MPALDCCATDPARTEGLWSRWADASLLSDLDKEWDQSGSNTGRETGTLAEPTPATTAATANSDGGFALPADGEVDEGAT